MARFHNGQTVICVRGGANPHAARRYPGLRWPVKGRRYTIRCAKIPLRVKATFVLVTDITNRTIRWPCGTRYEAGFWEDRFEPATDISQFNAVRDMVGLFHGEVDHEDEPDSHPTDEPDKKKERA